MKPELSYHVPGVPVEGMVNNALQELLNTGAWEGSGKEFLVLPADSNGQVAQELQQLQSVGYACVRHCGPPGAGPQFWQLQLQAQERITVCHVLHPGKQVLMEPRENVPLAEYSAWELLRTLEKQGWTWKAAPRSNDAQGKLSPVMKIAGPTCSSSSAIGAKIWFTIGDVLRLPYLRALAAAETLFNNEPPVVMIRHLQSTEYYLKLEAGTSDGQCIMMLTAKQHKHATAEDSDKDLLERDAQRDHAIDLPAQPNVQRAGRRWRAGTAKLTAEARCKTQRLFTQ
jgi:hypothetical protein